MECYYEKQIVGIPIPQIAIFLRAPFNSQIPSTYFHACLYLTVEKSLLGHAVESCYGKTCNVDVTFYWKLIEIKLISLAKISFFTRTIFHSRSVVLVDGQM